MPRRSRDKPITFPIPREELNSHFFASYSTIWWTAKARLLQRLIEDESFQRDYTSDEIVSGFPPDDLVRSCKAELHYLQFHTSEALFSLVFAILHEPELPWLWLCDYSSGELASLIQELAGGSLRHPGQGDKRASLRELFYLFIGESYESWGLVSKSIDVIWEYLQKLAVEFLDHAEYNSYKHGQRSFIQRVVYELRSEGDESTSLLSQAGDAVTFLDIEYPVGEKYRVATLTTKFINYLKAINIIAMNAALADNIVSFWRTKLRGAGTVNFNLFHDKDANAIFDIEPGVPGAVIVKFTLKKVPVRDETREN